MQHYIMCDEGSHHLTSYVFHMDGWYKQHVSVFFKLFFATAVQFFCICLNYRVSMSLSG